MIAAKQTSWIVAFASLLVLVVAVSPFVLGTALTDDAAKREMRQRIKAALTKLADGVGKWEHFALTYDDLHGLHGGFTLRIDGAGKVTQKAVREKVGEPKGVSPRELKHLVRLLLEHRAWEQRERDRTAVPDESDARLTITYRGDAITIWEWYIDLEKNERIVVIREAMKEAAWKNPPAD